MTFFDGVLLFIILYFIWSGFKSGFIRTAGAILGLLIGVYLASRYYEMLAGAWTWLFFGNATIAKIVVFILIFLLVDKVLKLAVFVVDKAFDLLRFIPFSKLANKLAGAVFGLIEGSLVGGMIIFILVRFPVAESLQTAIKGSQLANQLLYFVNVLTPLIPEALEKMEILVK